MSAPQAVFDAALVRRRLIRASRGRPADFLLARSAEDLVDRLRLVQREFRSIADLGTPGPALTQALRAGLPEALVVRLAPAFRCDAACDLETLPLAPESLDLAVSALALQTINDLPGTLVQIRRALKPDGLFLASMFGGRTLAELRSVLTEAEAELTAGASPRVAPFADVRDMGGLLQRAGFALPVADSETVTVRYGDLFALMADLRAMGATNSLLARSRRPTSRALFRRAAEFYAKRHVGPDGRIVATFEIISLSGWAPHNSQQQPARRGSATISLADVLGEQAGNFPRG